MNFTAQSFGWLGCSGGGRTGYECLLDFCYYNLLKILLFS